MKRAIAAGLGLGLVVASSSAAFAESPPHVRVVELFTELGAELDAASTDCDKVASALQTWVEKHGQEVVKLSDTVGVQADQLGEAELQEMEQKLGPAVEKVVTAAMQCATHEGTQKAFEALEKSMGAADPAATPPTPAEPVPAKAPAEPVPVKAPAK